MSEAKLLKALKDMIDDLAIRAEAKGATSLDVGQGVLNQANVAIVEYEKHLAAEQAVEPVQQWRSMDSAPKDGTYVIVSNGQGVWIAKHAPVYQSGWKPDCPWQTMMLNHDHIPRAGRFGMPTAWMPLPDCPKE